MGDHPKPGAKGFYSFKLMYLNHFSSCKVFVEKLSHLGYVR